jgi:hypothetical protein
MATATRTNGNAAAKAKEAGSTASSAARSAKRPVLTAGAAAAGLVGGVALGSRLNASRRGVTGLVRPRPRVLGVPLGRRSGLQWTVETLGRAAREVGSATRQVSSTTDEIRQVREELEKSNRQSPVEVLLNALTYRRGMNKHQNSP